MSFYRFSAHNGPSLDINLATYCGRIGPTFVSAFGYNNAVQSTVQNLKKKCQISLDYTGYQYDPKEYTVCTSRIPESDYTHFILYKKDGIKPGSDSGDILQAYLFVEHPNKELEDWFTAKWSGNKIYKWPEQIIQSTYDKLYKLSPLPVLKEWIPYLLKCFDDFFYFSCCAVLQADHTEIMRAFAIEVPIINLKEFIQNGLKNNEITINGCTRTSPFMQEVEGIDAYLQNFTEPLTRKIQQSFVPRFLPQKSQHDNSLKDIAEFLKWNTNVSLYPAQKDTAQAIVNAYNSGKKCAFICSEMGAGKTKMGITTICAHNAEKKLMTNVVMCPSHLVQMWKREIEETAPRSEAIIVKDFDHLISLIPLIKGENAPRFRHVWLIISKEIAKLGYALRPAVFWSKSKKAFRCPKCGGKLCYHKMEGKGWRRHKVSIPLEEEDFRNPSVLANNITCENMVKVWNHSIHDWEWKICGQNLWTVSTKETLYSETNPTGWMKLGRFGWIQHQHLSAVKDKLRNKDKLSADEAGFLTAIEDALDGQDFIQVAPRKYPIAKYIKRYLKNKLDYVVLDELHELTAQNSLQAEAMGDLVGTAKYVLGLTGTLLNGYSSGIYFLLYRIFARKMKAEGYTFKNASDFIKEYGVVRQTRTLSAYDRYRGNRGKFSSRELPGISPLVFTKFLLENVAFMGLDDISDGLPPYEETPIPIAMSSQLQEAYQKLTEDVRQVINRVSGQKEGRVIPQLLQLLSIFPDQPYDLPSVVNPDTGETLLDPPELEKDYSDKDRMLLTLVQAKTAAGESVLIYYHWTNKSDVRNRISRLLNENNISNAELTTKVPPQERENWIKSQTAKGVKVILCNPKLVETGLTLLDFTTIIFYQLGYNLYTMRQAARRSWRINQPHDVQVYFLYFRGTVQESALSVMATKLEAAMALEGKFSDEGLRAMSDNEDVLTQIASSVSEGIAQTVDIQIFQKSKAGKAKQSEDNIVSEMEEDEDFGYLPVQVPPLYENIQDVDTDSVTKDMMKQIYRARISSEN